MFAAENQATSTAASSKQIIVLHFERQVYPLYARLRAISGVVILKASIDSAGLVDRVAVLQGPEALREDAAKNLKRWRFAQPRQADVLVVYWFRISGLCEPPCESNYEFFPPNLAIISVGSEVATP
jgi:TonB family protein